MVANQDLEETPTIASLQETPVVELEGKKILKEAQCISIIGYQHDMLYLKDTRKNHRIIEVQVLNKTLKCITDDSDECIHVNFALALPEVRDALQR